MPLPTRRGRNDHDRTQALLKSSDPALRRAGSRRCWPSKARRTEPSTTVAGILHDVKARGDAAVLEYTRRFDQLSRQRRSRELEMSAATNCKRALDNAARGAARGAANRRRRACASITRSKSLQSWSYTESRRHACSASRSRALDRVGLYVPGGKAAYPSSVLMNAMPAKVAGVQRTHHGGADAGRRGERTGAGRGGACGVDRVFTIGGAQAVGALAYGTQTVPQVDKIVGPGNAYVAAAKRRVFGVVGIDMVAGPSEILVICDGKTDPDWIAMDLFSQAEHDELAQSILLCAGCRVYRRGAASIERQLPQMPRHEIIAAALEGRGALIEVRDLDEACAHRQPHCARAPGTVGRRSRGAAAENPPCRRDFHGPLYLRGAGRLLRRPEPRAADFAHRALFLAAGRLRFPEALQPDQGVAGRRGKARHDRRRAGATARACRRTRARPSIG